MPSLLSLFCPPQFLLGEGRNGVAEEGVAEQGEQVGFCRGARTRLPDSINRTRQNHLDTDLFDLRCLLAVLVWLRHRRRSHRVSSRIGARMATGLDAMVSLLTRRRRLHRRSTLLLLPPPLTFLTFRR
jgi:hypothetical protein